MNEDAFPFENGDFPACHVSFQGSNKSNINPKGPARDCFWRSFSDALTPELLATLEALKARGKSPLFRVKNVP